MSESESRRALVFKGAMINEVNHRTKNTLQAAASLLVLHARATSSAQVRSALLDSYARLHLLAKVHELLYTTPDNAQTVLMPECCRYWQTGCDKLSPSPSSQVRLELTCDLDIACRSTRPFPWRCLRTKLVTNAYKHAFPNDSSGEITVSLQSRPGMS